MFYCKGCEEWHDDDKSYNKDLNVHDCKLPECLSVEDYCGICGEDVTDCFYDADEIITLLNEKKVKPGS